VRARGGDRPTRVVRPEPERQRPEAWRELLHAAEVAAAAGAQVRPQVHARTTSLLLGLDTFHPLNWTATWAEIGLLPVAEQVARLRGDDALRDRIVGEMIEAAAAEGGVIGGFMRPERMFQLGDPPDYEPRPEASVAARAAAAGISPWELVYDLLLVNDGHELLNAPILNYSDGNLDAAFEMLSNRCAPSASATAARTPARPATRRAPRSCSRTGPVTATVPSSGSRSPCTR